MTRNKLRDRRKALNMTQQELADRAHMSRTRYTEIENGANIQGDQIVALTIALEQKKLELIKMLQDEIKQIEQEFPVPDIQLFERCYEE